jgi:hypothetical protein
MKRGEKKTGRPAHYEKRNGSLRTVGFRVDDETYAALERLEAAVKATGGIRHPRSVALRRAILDTDARVTANGGKFE